MEKRRCVCVAALSYEERPMAWTKPQRSKRGETESAELGDKPLYHQSQEERVSGVTSGFWTSEFPAQTTCSSFTGLTLPRGPVPCVCAPLGLGEKRSAVCRGRCGYGQSLDSALGVMLI